jgi:chemotaxis protein methyltransferase CheR
MSSSIASSKSISDKDFERLSRFIRDACGIKITDVKRTMLEARLQKRLRVLQMESFTSYIDYLFSPSGLDNELTHMIDVVTTNKTDFFREPNHFQYLAERGLPELIKSDGCGSQRPLMVWSAGCSTGEEPYTIAMVLQEFSDNSRSRFNYIILATDISTRVLERAAMAIYSEETADAIPPAFRKKYLLRSRDRSNRLVRISPELRARIRFRRLNFMDGDFGFREGMDIIFCRNVLIYFDRKTQETLLGRFCDYLVTGGHVFVGHSETLFGMDLPLVQVVPTIYRKV